MDYFPMLHGTVNCVGSTIMSLKFLSMEGYECDAVAVREVCYVGESLSQRLQVDFRPGQRVQLSAVRDPTSIVPEAWKTIVVWTTYKPFSCFKLGDWHTILKRLYSRHLLIQNIISGCTDAFMKNVSLERMAVVYLSERIYSDLQRNVTHRIDDCDLDGIFSSSSRQIDEYIQTVYGSVADFIAYHSMVFEISSRGNIFILMSGNNLDVYFSKTLAEKIKTDNKQFKCGEARRPVDKEPEKIYQLEVEAISHFYFRLKEVQEALGIVYCLSSKCLEELQNRSPDLIRSYVKQAYKSLGDFLMFHKEAFLFGPCSTVFPTTQRKWNVYLNAGLDKVVSNDSQSERLYDLFVYRHKVTSEKTKQCLKEIQDDQKLNADADSVRRPRSTKFVPRRDSKVVETDQTKTTKADDVANLSRSVDNIKSTFTALNLLD